ncbi:MAG TPA: hypothetical protein PKA66_07365 [Gemmatimonadales bacterium]|nr:hypothetical protein [Gemmatimonadales bacterium]
MQPEVTKVPAVRVVQFGTGQQAQFRPVASAGSKLAGLDFRIYREVLGTNEYSLTQSGFRVPLPAIRETGRVSLAAANTPRIHYTVHFNPVLQLQLRPVADAATGLVIGIDYRLYRAERATGVFMATRAGLVAPQDTMPEVAGAFLDIADEMGVAE